MEVGLYLPVYSRSFREGNTIFSPWRFSCFVTKPSNYIRVRDNTIFTRIFGDNQFHYINKFLTEVLQVLFQLPSPVFDELDDLRHEL